MDVLAILAANSLFVTNELYFLLCWKFLLKVTFSLFNDIRKDLVSVI